VVVLGKTFTVSCFLIMPFATIPKATEPTP